MPFTLHQGARLYWKVDGEASKPPLLLLNSIGTDMGAWEPALPYLLTGFRTVRFDARGHGASDATPGDYSLELLAQDAGAVLDAAGVDRAVVCGVSLGGMVAMTLALQAPGRVKALVAACSSPRMDPETWSARIAAVRSGGMASVADAALARFFSTSFTTNHPEVTGGVRAGLVAASVEGYAGSAAAIRDMDLRGRLGEIAAPTLVIAGEQDVSTPFPEHGRLISEGIPGAKVVLLGAGHLAQLEAPAAFAAAVLQFTQALDRGPTPAEAAEVLYQSGLSRRREVLGDEWVDRSLAAVTPFNADYQAMITRIAWNEIWTRPGLDPRTRRLLVVAITASLGRWEEFRLHVRTGLQRGGFTQDELKETLMQTAIYAGVPAANTAFMEASEVIRGL